MKPSVLAVVLAFASLVINTSVTKDVMEKKHHHANKM